MRIGLVACGKVKRDRAVPARELYTSSLFQKASAYAAKNYDFWYILSAKHHLLDPERMIAPYDVTLKRMNAAQRRAWATEVCRQLREQYPLSAATHVEFYFHAGMNYRRYLVDCLRSNGFVSHAPLEGLAIGKQLQWYSEHAC